MNAQTVKIESGVSCALHRNSALRGGVGGQKQAQARTFYFKVREIRVSRPCNKALGK